MENKDYSAFPVSHFAAGENWIDGGMTKREWMAAMAMQGLIQSYTISRDEMAEFTATMAVKYAEALLAELAKLEGD